jgi:hypothetical protein
MRKAIRLSASAVGRLAWPDQGSRSGKEVAERGHVIRPGAVKLVVQDDAPHFPGSDSPRSAFRRVGVRRDRQIHTPSVVIFEDPEPGPLAGVDTPKLRQHALDMRYVFEVHPEVEVAVVTGLLAEQRVYAPTPIDPPVDPGGVEAVEHLNHVVCSHGLMLDLRSASSSVQASRLSRLDVAAVDGLGDVPTDVVIG